MTDDPLSGILKLIDAQSLLTGGFSAGGAWALRFPEPENMKFFGLVKGECWLRMDGIVDPIRVKAGDFLLLAARRSFVLAGELTAKPIDATEIFVGTGYKTAILGDGQDCVQIGGHVRLDPGSGRILTDALPPVIHVDATSSQAPTLHLLLETFVEERIAERPGASLALAQLAQLMFIQTLRAYLEVDGPLPAGWLRAITDARIAPALSLLHGDPGRRWSLGELANAAGMSRTAFAVRFKAAADIAPLAYLVRWRMRLAERLLRDKAVSIAQIAQTLGYSSESAFSNAFKRVTGKAPGRFRASLFYAINDSGTISGANR